ncbi:multifunctional oxoglutarate decarboxylase/oxoglutarate dehydrogenase thiamine pyrophosphate-binding subunit/dihydrolipoyllysine-residue succinyltransferase subunit [Planomonospora sp. ID67723]|uniref:multifunctional oxoglutarate decarboxylase/oxoglutarate dehydrogenase thiamine pyrophosphate-binding subunit/dihydrolipoyllysine-residue succinyltransferase subunit n=1 Tax=Planomonospora sp. ID67723 TaxID=2738134 RepID=UPI0018C3888D|nr:multifunctional oxoglutarate decarboxylase/oxoglutarate dehydrogenase thiamine pyrophosphate-binding subunit/dihydrolipoyllysine-residue succinyltransferase subunit [Planomonospora sp. ID67723]MBG0832171.1 multifunctional oxoglutarate decarboxylase/oxoglutarate dehydrogenase thiamine pyrophosphate-binding subunit/dihydrolipoyllysine-residue succinyltransferase subunit [Planomonospora sp. ID67723]
MSSESSRTNPLAAFGQNEWLVDELYQKYLQDPESVDRAWWNFFADYTPDSGSGRAAAQGAATAAPPTPATAPATPAAATTTPTAPKAEAAPADKPKQETQLPAGAEEVRLRGAAARTAANMEASLVVPTATSVRAVPAKLLIDNRIVINNHLSRGRGGKVSFTHLIGFAVVKALKALPEMNHSYAEVDGKPVLVKPEHVNLGLAIDIQKGDTRQLLVPSIKACEEMDFRQFWVAYEDIVRKARAGKLGVDDFAGTSISLTNPGTIGTVHSVPRLMQGQGAIIGVGAMEYPAEYQGASPDTLSRLAVSKVMTLTSTYDHRIIQGAQSGDFLRQIHRLLLGEDGFYDEIFEALRIPYEPVRWVQDISTTHDDDVAKSARVIELIHAFRVRGHLMADTDPLEYKQRKHPDLDIKSHGLTLWDLEREFATGGFGGRPLMKLREILGVLRDSYCRTIGVEYMHMQNPEERAWIQARVERPHAKPDREEQLRVLERLNTAEAFETFLQTKFVGQKRFSLEGGESLIPLLDSVLCAAAQDQLDEAVIGMAHRGRLNVLANIVGKSYGQIFGEFEGNIDPRSSHGSGDVKYHLGATGDFVSPDGSKIKASVVANPSHLETVDPVLEGVVRAKQDLLERGEEGFTVLPVLVHGDAAFAGQGVVAETLNLSQLRGYRTGGTVHIVVNNQVGFTTSPASSRSSVYATDVARMIQAPIFHVNGDDPEAVVRVGRLAFEYRQAFRKDVVIDLICYRRRGHNEADNPSFTQPLMYDLIDAKRSTRKLYTEALIGRGDITVEEAESALRDYQAKLENAFAETREAIREHTGEFHRPADLEAIPWSHEDTPTGVSEETVKRIVDTQLNLPEGFTVHPRLLPVIQRRGQMVAEDRIDWGMGETLAFGSLLIDGHPVRLVGQDSRRGTFVQRHAVLVDRVTGAEHTPLKTFNEGTTKFYVYDSLLSEYAALGFEYGYSVERPEALVCWEAQFGDFVNGAQSVIDEYITAGEQKWGQRSGVTLLLPHGYEGQGPDHSSARIERFLQMCAQDNMTVAQPTLPANYFHLLRWQTKSNRHRPLVVFTPKSLLRHKAAVSAVSEFTSGSFKPVLGDTTVNPAEVRKVVLCSGKIYYDLASAREKQGRTDVAIVRLERLYPFPANPLATELARYGDGVELIWAQDEPANMGPWPFLTLRMAERSDTFGGRPVKRVSRRANSSPATGSHSAHEAELAQILDEVYA